jgi:hypothetical protein
MQIAALEQSDVFGAIVKSNSVTAQVSFLCYLEF